MNMDFRSGLLNGRQQLSRPTDTIHGGLESDPLIGQGVGEAAAARKCAFVSICLADREIGHRFDAGQS